MNSRINIVLIIIISTIIFICNASCTKTTENYDQYGHLTSSIQMRRGQPDGKTLIYFNDGITILQESNYKNGKLNGKSTRWFFTGHKEYEEYYVDDKLQGKKSTWNENGTLMAEDNYEKGLLNGNCNEWYSNGQLQMDTYYKNGLPDSIWNYYDYNGLEVGFAKFDNGTGQQVAISPDNLIKITYFVDGDQTNDTIMPYTPKRYEQIKQSCVKK